MAKKKVNALENFITQLEQLLLASIPSLANQGLSSILHKNKAKIKDAAVPVKANTLVQDIPHPDSGEPCQPGYIRKNGVCIKDPGL